jgi:ATP-binding cassette subfamily B protein
VTSPVVDAGRGLVRANRPAWLGALSCWTAFHGWPLATGLVLKAVLDRVAGDADAVSLWGMVAVLAAVEVGRWGMLFVAVVQYAGTWIGLETVPRTNLMRSLVGDPGPAAGRLPGSPGEAVSRFRDDVRDLAMVTDVWIDVTAAALSTAVALAVLASVDAWLTFVVVLPVLAALAVARLLGPKLKAWRTASREATAAVTGYLGDLFGATLAVKAAGAEGAAGRRFALLNDARRHAARRDQVGSALVESLAGVTGEIGVGLMLLLAAPALRRGDLGVGDLALFTTYVTVLATLPRWVGRLSSYHRQADVSVRRLAELDARRDPARVVAGPTGVDLRRGPAPLVLPAVRAPAPGSLWVRGLTARHGAGTGRGVVDVDLDVGAGQLVAVTGAVGSGKTTLLRAVLGLVERQAGEIRWDGALVDDPSIVLVPPVAAYVPQVPRVFSETLAETVLLGLAPDTLHEALELARLGDDLAAMPAGVGTEIGARGVRLSGGQLQRVATARALARRPALLVVDDLSSALDAATESALWDGLLGARTFGAALVVTHRQHVLDRADVVVRLDAGRRVS